MGRLGGTDGPEDVDATFAEIVADLRSQGVGEQQPDDAPPPAQADSDDAATASWREAGSEWEDVLFGKDPAPDDEHYVPPEPPPLPKPRRGAFIVLLFFVLGIVLLVAPTLFGLPEQVGMPLGMLSLVTAIALLLLRIRQGPPEGSDPDNGAQV